MENIHLLPASKQEYQVKEGGLFINDTRKYSWGKLEALICERVTQHGHAWNGTGIRTDICHLYITSNEEIKEGDWYLDTTINVIFKNDKLFLNGTGYKKIILTTDQDLIADGVQAIDDEFLEWFVKNPSCEFVEVTRDFADEGIKGITYYGKYFIIIPKEESKQEGYICPHTKIQCDDECCVSAEDCHITSSLASGMVDCDEPKQETLEKAANNWVTQPVIGTKRESFIAGAKWQFERMYTYDELRQIAYNAYCKGQLDNPTEGEFNLWIQQFKKK